jgi:ribonuclease HI
MWLVGFAKALGDTTTYMAELWGIYEGLKLAKHRGTTRIEVRTDSQVIAQSLKERRKGSRMVSKSAEKGVGWVTFSDEISCYLFFYYLL